MARLGLLMIPSEIELNAFLPGVSTRSGLFHEADAVGLEWAEGRVAVVVCGTGKARAAAYTAVACERFHPDWVVMAGMAGAAHVKDAGHWFLPDELMEGDYRPYGVGDVRPLLRYDLALYERLRISIQGHGKIMTGGRLLCADQDELPPYDRSDLVDKWKATAIAWDSAGFVRGCIASGYPYAELRMLMDLNGGMPHQEVAERMEALGDLSLEMVLRRLLSS